MKIYKKYFKNAENPWKTRKNPTTTIISKYLTKDLQKVIIQVNLRKEWKRLQK